MEAEVIPITEEEHKDHHEFLRECAPLLRDFLEERKRAQKRWEKIRDTAVGTVVVAIVTGLIGFFSWIGKIVLEHLQRGGL